MIDIRNHRDPYFRIEYVIVTSMKIHFGEDPATGKREVIITPEEGETESDVRKAAAQHKGQVVVVHKTNYRGKTTVDQAIVTLD